MFKKILILVFLFIGICFFAYKKEEAKTFTFWTIQLKSNLSDLMNKNIEIFQKKHPDIKIVWVDIPISEAKKRTIASILGGNPPDLINLNPEFSYLLAKKNSLEFFDQSDLFPYNQNIVNKLKYKGKIYGIPFYATSSVTIIRKDKFKNYKDIKTYDDILYKNFETKPVFGINLSEGDVFSKILNKYDIDSYDDDFDSIYLKFKKMYDKNLLLKDTLTVSHQNVIEKYMSDSANIIIGGGNFINTILNNAPDVYKKTEITPQLTGTNGKYDASIMNFVIPKKAKNKELAKEFILLLLNKENQLELAKKTNVLPVNIEALNDNYFKICSSDLIDKARCISRRQLENLSNVEFSTDKKQTDEVINRALEILFLKGEDEYKKFDLQKKLNFKY